jgi:transposase
VVATAKVLTGWSQRAVARHLGVHRSYLTRWLRRDAETGSVADQCVGVRSTKWGKEMDEELVQLVQQKPSSGLRQLAAAACRRAGGAVPASTVKKCCRS